MRLGISHISRKKNLLSHLTLGTRQERADRISDRDNWSNTSGGGCTRSMVMSEQDGSKAGDDVDMKPGLI